MLLEIAGATLVTVTLGGTIVRYRSANRSDRPLQAWGRSWTSAGIVAVELAVASGLAATEREDRWGWLTTLVLAPVWLFWGDLRAQRPELQLGRWRFLGALASGRNACIDLHAERASLSVACGAHASLWASASDDGEAWPLEQQEGLRFLHPIGGERWKEGTTLVKAAFEQGLDRLRLEGGHLRAEVGLGEHAPAPARYKELLEAMDALAAWIEMTARS